MSCQQISQLLVESVAAAERSEVKEHLDSCEECRRLLAQLRELETLRFALSSRQKAPEDFSSRVFEAVEGKRQSIYWKLAVTLVAAGLGLALAAGRFTAEPLVRNGPVIEEPAATGLSTPLLPNSEFYYLGDQPMTGAEPVVEVELIDSKGRVRIVRIPMRIEIRRRDLGQASGRAVSY